MPPPKTPYQEPIAPSTTRVQPTEVAVPHDTPEYWLDALQRCGVLTHRDLGAGLPVVFVPPECNVSIERLRGVFSRGAAVVGDGRVARDLAGTVMTVRKVEGIQGDGALFEGCNSIRMKARIRTTSEFVHIDNDGAAPVVALPLPQARSLLGQQPSLHEFPAHPQVDVHEIVSAADHGGIRRLLQNGLRLATHLNGQSFVRCNEHPAGFSGALAIRIDANDFDPRATETVIDSLDRANMRATWFIDVERHAQKGGADTIRAIVARGDEIQSHFFHHYTYRSATKNHRNLERSRQLLSEWGIETCAAATPFGTFHDGVLGAFRASDIAWSSEFSARYDDAPGFDHGRVQVPVHPVRPVLLLDAGCDEREVHDYYARRLVRHLSRGETAVFYGHPIRDLEAVPDLFAFLRRVLDEHEADTGAPVWQPTLGELKDFHDHRRRMLLDLEVAVDVPTVSYPPSTADEDFDVTCEAWQPRDPSYLHRKQRSIRFRRWLREVRRGGQV